MSLMMGSVTKFVIEILEQHLLLAKRYQYRIDKHWKRNFPTTPHKMSLHQFTISNKIGVL